MRSRIYYSEELKVELGIDKDYDESIELVPIGIDEAKEWYLEKQQFDANGLALLSDIKSDLRSGGIYTGIIKSVIEYPRLYVPYVWATYKPLKDLYETGIQLNDEMLPKDLKEPKIKFYSIIDVINGVRNLKTEWSMTEAEVIAYLGTV